MYINPIKCCSEAGVVSGLFLFSKTGGCAKDLANWSATSSATPLPRNPKVRIELALTPAHSPQGEGEIVAASWRLQDLSS